MSLDKKLFKAVATTTTTTSDAAQGLVLHLDANDEDSIEQGGANDGNTNGTWFDISTHDLNVPLVDKASNLQLHLNASDTTSYGGSGDEWTDISQNSNHAEDTNPTFSSDTRGYFEMDGSNDYFTIDYDASLYMTSNTGFTIEAWVNRDSGSEMYIIASDDNSSYPYALSWNTNTHGYYGWISGSGYDGGSGVVGSNETSTNGVGEWDHVVMTQSSVDRKNRMYVNGTLVSTSAVVTGFHSTSSDVYVGTYHDQTSKFDGKIGVIRIYNVELTASDVAQNFRADCFLSYDSYITSRDSATQGTLITAPPTQGTLHSTNLQINLDANTYSGSGDWLDGANDYDATITAATYTDFDNSDYFDFAGSTNNPVSISYNSILNASARTWEFWVWFDTDAMNFFGGVWGTNNSDKTVIFRMKDSNNAIRAQVYDGAGTSVEPTTDNNVVSEGEWNHIVFTSDNSDNSFKIYVNGIKKYSDTLSIDMNTSSTGNFIIGAGGGYSSNRLDGRIAQFRYYNAALSGSEVNTNYNATKDLYQGATNIELHLDANGYISGEWSDSSGNSRNGTITDAVHTNDNNSDYFTFDGATGTSGDKVLVPHTTDLDIVQSFSIEMWVWRNDDTDHCLINKGPNNTNSWDISFGASSGFGYQFNSYDGGAQVRTGTGDFTSANRWEHIVLTYDNSTKKPDFFIDGVLRVGHTHTAGSLPNGNSNDLIIGGYYQYPARHGWNGRIAQVRFYKGKLTQDQVITNYNATKALYQNPTALIDYRPSNYSGSGTSITNLGSLSNDAVLTGGIESTYDKELGDFFTIEGGSNTGDGIETTSNVTGVNLNTDGFSWEIWVNFTSDGYSYITSFNYSSTYYNFSYRQDSDKVTFFNLGTSLNTPALELNRWYHIVGTANSAGTKLYTDGILSDSNTTAAPNHNLDSKIYFGTYWGHSSAQHIHTGPIGDGRFYKGVLTAEQVAQNYLASKKYYPNGNHFTNSGATFTYSSTPYYFNFDGSNDVMNRTLSNFSYRLDDEYTVTQWLRADSVGSTQITFNTYGTSNGAQLVFKSGPILEWYHSGTSTLQMSKSVSATTWYMAAVTFDGTNGKLYLSTTSSFDSSPSTDTGNGLSNGDDTNISIGGRSPYFFDGRIAATRVYHKALSASELETIWTAEKATF